MKKIILSAGFIMAFIPFLSAQGAEYKVVFDLTSKDTAIHSTLMRWINGISQGTPEAELEVVFYGQSLRMITKGKSVVKEDIENALANKIVSFKVCAVSMQKHNITADELIDGVEIVPDGIYQIITRQGQGWGYIKVGQ